MRIQFIRKWRDSVEGNCPALYLMEWPVRSMDASHISAVVRQGANHRTMRLPAGTMFVVQGWTLSPDERAQLRNLAPDEDAVRVPADVLQGIRVPFLSRNGGTAHIETSLGGAARRITRVAHGTLLIVQGWKIEADIREQLRDLAPDEDAVLVPVDVIAGIRITKLPSLV